jgi:hypothetical protein
MSSFASAQDETGPRSRVISTAPSHAFELTLGSGFAQGFGDVSKTMHLADLAGEGASLQLGLGYRASPRFMIGVYAEGSGYDAGDLNSKAAHPLGAAAGLQAQWHYAPFRRVHPWLGVGAGWRGYWESGHDSMTRSLQGADLLRMQLGTEVRLSPGFSLSPLLSVSLAEYFAQKQPGADNFHAVDSPRSNVFLFAGALGRFDIGGSRKSSSAGSCPCSAGPPTDNSKTPTHSANAC